MLPSIFGRPINAALAGGMHITIDLITIHKGKLVLFEKQGGTPGHQNLNELWFPGDYLSYGEELVMALKRVLKTWGKVEPVSMKLVKVDSTVPPNEGWRMAFLYVVELKAPAKPGAGMKAIKVIEQSQLPRTVGWLRRSEIKNFIALAKQMQPNR